MPLFIVRIEVPTSFDVRLHVPQSSGLGELKELLVQLAADVLNVKEIVMATAAEFTEGFARIDAATTAIAERLRVLGESIGSMTAEQEEAAKAELLRLAAVLEPMGQVPTDPVPVPVPVPTP